MRTKPGWTFLLNDMLGDEDTAAVLPGDPGNALYALITSDSPQKPFPELRAHVPAEKRARSAHNEPSRFP